MVTENRSAGLAGLSAERQRISWARRQWAVARFARQKPLGAMGFVVVLGLIVTAILAPAIAPRDPLAISGKARLLPPSLTYLMGTDEQGRDVFSRVVYGARTSLLVATLAVVVDTFLALVIGILTGYLGGKVDAFLQRGVDAVIAFPFLVLALTLVMILGGGIVNVGFLIGLVSGVRDSRVLRGAVMSIKENQYMEAARAIGCGDLRIMVHHVARNLFAPLMVISTLLWGNAILIEASLSFLGFGVPPPQPSWGNMISGEARRFLELAPWITIFPGVALSLAVFGFNMLGDALRDVLDPRLRGTGR